MNSVHLINIMKWRERVQFLTSQNKFVPGLELAMAMHDDTALAVRVSVCLWPCCVWVYMAVRVCVHMCG